MSFSVVVIAPNARRKIIKVSPNTSILQILENACKKQKLNPDDFDLRHYSKTLDLSLPIRFANIPNNAVLELIPAKNVRRECLVTVALQLESGERYTKDFDPNSSIYNVVDECLSSESIKMADVGEPVCIYMRQKISGDAIKNTTLRNLGLTKGQAIIRLLYRRPEDLEHQAHVSAPLKPTSASETQKCTLSNAAVPQPLTKQTITYSTIEVPVAMELDNHEDLPRESNASPDVDSNHNSIAVEAASNNVHKEEVDDSNILTKIESQEETDDTPIGDIIYVGSQQAVIYSLDAITSTIKADLPDEFFDLTINDARYLMDEYKRERTLMENQPLLTKEQRDMRILKKLSKYHQTVLRIYFPERLVLQTVFSVLDTVQAVCDFIRDFLEDRDLKFYLYITPPKQILHPCKTLIESMLVPASVLYFGCDTRLPSYLKKSLREEISDPRAAALAAIQSRENNVSSVPVIDIPSVNTNVQICPPQAPIDTSSSSTHSATRPKSAKVPAWFKMK